jgi:hypothetical protein
MSGVVEEIERKARRSKADAFTAEVDAQPLITYTKGQAFFEPAGAVHRVSRIRAPPRLSNC